jgi:hypothetical protein
MGQNFSLGRIAGIRIGVNWSVLVIVALLAYGLAAVTRFLHDLLPWLRHSASPVVDDGQTVGLVTVRRVDAVPADNGRALVFADGRLAGIVAPADISQALERISGNRGAFGSAGRGRRP